MWVTAITILAFCLYLTALFGRSRYFYLHSFFLIPIYPVIFFIDHNAYYIIPGLKSDSVHFAIKLLPLYLNMGLLAARFRPKRHQGVPVTTLILNTYLVYTVLLAAMFSMDRRSWLPLFFVSYSAPLFALFANSRNFAEEVTVMRNSRSREKLLLHASFIVFIIIYFASIAYSIGTGATESLMDSRGVGSVFASTSALIYCILYAPLLASLSRRRWPHLVTMVIGVTSLSKTALLVLPGYAIAIYRRMRARFTTFLGYAAGAAVLAALLIPVLPDSLFDLWKLKFALEGDETLFEKAYETRLDIYRDALIMIREHPLGIGVGNFEHYSHTGYRDSHNFVINTLAESGVIFGLLLILAFFAAFGRTMLQIGRGHYEFHHSSLLSVFLVYSAAGGVLQTTGNSDITTIYYTPFYGVAIFQFLNLLDGTPSR